VPALRKLLASLSEEESRQLAQACDLFESVLNDGELELSHGDCRRAGDCLIALEAKHHATHAVSTNARDWTMVSQLLGMEFVHVRYPDEETR